MPLIKAEWNPPDSAGLQTAEWGGYTLRVYPLAAPDAPIGLISRQHLPDDPEHGFGWGAEIDGVEYAGWSGSRGAARAQALGRAYHHSIGHNSFPHVGKEVTRVVCRRKDIGGG